GFFLQVKETDANYTGAANSGIFVFQNGNTVATGNRVTLTSATVSNFFGRIELVSPVVMVMSATAEAPPAPVVEKAPGVLLTAADLGMGGSQSQTLQDVIVGLSNVMVTDANPPAGTGDTPPINEFVIDGAVRVNDLLYLVTPSPVLGEQFITLRGI